MADVFVGTYYSSNVGRFVAIMREANDKPSDSSMSVDINPWFPG